VYRSGRANTTLGFFPASSLPGPPQQAQQPQGEVAGPMDAPMNIAHVEQMLASKTAAGVQGVRGSASSISYSGNEAGIVVPPNSE